MKPIKCPNCGKRMESQWEDVGDMTEGYFECTSCGVRGPRASAECPKTVICLSARLAREWIARMEAKTCKHAVGCLIKKRIIDLNDSMPPYMRKIFHDFKPEVTP